MKKIVNFLNSKTKKVAAIVACGAVIATLGTATASAFANGNEPTGGSLIRNENGQVSYSNDDGATWIEGTPENYHVEYHEDGSSLSWVGERAELGSDAFMARNENGQMYYSNDGGATWSTETPDDLEQTVNPDGSVSIQKK